MAATSELDRVAMVVLRHLRSPVFVLIAVYGIGITGMALIPGRDAQGNVEYMSLFHAFYFFTYTATTTGFGEIPNVFTDEQRLWTIFCLYMGVIAWLYAIGSIIRLVQNPHFTMALNEHRFASSVRRIKQPFFIICGFGDTGSLLARGLSDHLQDAVVIDSNIDRIKAHALRDYSVKMPALCADPGVPRHLVDAGVKHPMCQAVVVLTKDEEINLRITVMARFLNPDLPVLCRSKSPSYCEHLATLDNVTVINPFEIFAQLLSLAIAAPKLHNLNSCLVHNKGAVLGKALDVPTGDWILCGYGRMGKWLHQYFARHDIHPVLIDSEVEDVPESSRVIRGPANRESLEEAGIHKAAGVVAGTDNDHGNLNILMSIQTLRPDVFTIVRQNSHENQVAFDAANVDVLLQPSLTTARRVLKHLISPQIQGFIDYLEEQGETVTDQVVQRLLATIGSQQPHLWRVKLCEESAAAVVDFLHTRGRLSLSDIIRNPYELSQSISCIPIVLERGANKIMLPDASEALVEADTILFCGTRRSETLLSATMNNPYTLHYLVTGIDAPRGYVFRWLASVLSD